MTDDAVMPVGSRNARGWWLGWTGALVALATVILLASACSEFGRSSAQGEEPVVSVDVHASTQNAHVPIVVVDASPPATVTVTATSLDHTIVTPTSGLSSSQEIPILGLRTDRDYVLSVATETEDGTEDRYEVADPYRTPPLPADFPPFDVTSDAEQVSPGVTLLPLMWISPDEGESVERDGDQDDLATGRVIGVDEAGEVVWYYETELQVISVEPTQHGTLILGLEDANIHNLDGVAREIDMLGNTVAEWSTTIAEASGKSFADELDGSVEEIAVDVDSFHHDVHELANGNLLALSTELIELSGTAGRELCPDSPVSHVVSDVVVEFQRDGEVVGQWPVAAGYDPMTRPGVEMCGDRDLRAAGDWMYPEAENERDWTHGNSVILDDANNTLIVSLRHFDAVIGLRYSDDGDGPAGERLWELGPDGDLAMQGDGLFQRHQHAPELREDGTLILYDNGNLRPGNADDGGAKPPFSRAVIYKIDPDAGTVLQVWEHRDENPWGGPTFSPFLGDADTLENGNVLITHGAALDQAGRSHARVVEIVPDIDGEGSGDEAVLDLVTGSNVGESWIIFHAEKLPSLYP